MGKRVESYSYFSSLWALFLSTLKSIRVWVLLVILLDFLFYAGAFGMATLGANKIKADYEMLSFPDPSTQQNISPQDAAAMLEQMKSFRSTTFTLLAAISIGVIVLWSVCKGLIWSITLKEKIKLQTLWKFLMLNAAWLGCWMLLISSLAYVINFAQAQYFFLGLLGFFVLLTSSIYTFFIPSPSFASFKQGITTAITKFHLLALPTILLFLVYVLFSKLFTLSAHIAAQIGLLIFTLLYVAIARKFFAAVVQSLHHKE